MKRLLTIVALTCAVAFQAHAQFDIEVIIEVDPNSGSVMYFPPQTYNEIVRRYQEFKNKK